MHASDILLKGEIYKENLYSGNINEKDIHRGHILIKE